MIYVIQNVSPITKGVVKNEGRPRGTDCQFKLLRFSRLLKLLFGNIMEPKGCVQCFEWPKVSEKPVSCFEILAAATVWRTAELTWGTFAL